MFIQVQLLKGYQQPLLYAVPAQWEHTDLVGALVRVPFRTSVVSAVVIEQMNNKPADATFAIKAAHALEPFPHDLAYHRFIEQLSNYNQIDPIHCVKRMRQFLLQKEVVETEEPIAQEAQPFTNKVTLTEQQQAVCDYLAPYVNNGAFVPTVLHGVTGSGKTEVYKELIVQAVNLQKTVLLMLPEVTLAVQFYNLLKKQLPHDFPITTFHSGTSTKEKKQLWEQLLAKKPMLIIGVHLPILLPIANLGLIIVDEEHEVGYQEKKHPKINSKEAALLRAQVSKIPVLLGSATPSIATLHNVHTKGWKLFALTTRFSGAFPTIETVLLNDKKQRRSFWISQQLENAIRDRLRKKEQTIIFINRRGFSFFVQCKQCSFIFNCRNCSVSLTLHENNQLHCHYCGLNQQQPSTCSQCSAPESEFLKKGIGTQQVVTILQRLFPQAAIGRADMDTTTKKVAWQKTMHDFQAGTIDILVGTQTITKGFHFPNVTLVGILWADLNLNMPMFNASETTLQQLIQVAGRAGRQRQHSTVIVQTMADHPVFNYLNEIDYVKFYEMEMANRREVGYPPDNRLAEIELKHTDELVIDRDAAALMQALLTISQERQMSVRILGPAKPPVHKVKNCHARKIYLKAQNFKTIHELYQAIKNKRLKSKIFFTPNPLS